MDGSGTGYLPAASSGTRRCAYEAAASRLAELSEHVRKCPNELVSNSHSNTCDPEDHSNGWHVT